MEVYAEYALAENFCMDFCLLFAAKAASKNRAGTGRICLASAAGACFAVLFPLMGLKGWAAFSVKLISGLLLCLAACASSGFKGYAKFTAFFMLFTFVLGGGLIALFSLGDVGYEPGGGYIISSVPVGIPLFLALMLALGVKKVFSKYMGSHSKIAVNCRIYAGQSQISLPAFFDSGNRVYYLGAPVSVLPRKYALKLLDADGIKKFVKIHTVAGEKKLPVFTADKLEIDYGEKVISLRGVIFCVSDEASDRAVLHPDIAEAK